MLEAVYPPAGREGPKHSHRGSETVARSVIVGEDEVFIILHGYLCCNYLNITILSSFIYLFFYLVTP